MSEKEELLNLLSKVKEMYQDAYHSLYHHSGFSHVLDCYPVLSFYNAWLYGGEFLFPKDSRFKYMGVARHNDKLSEYHKEYIYHKYRMTRNIEERINSASDYSGIRKELREVKNMLWLINSPSMLFTLEAIANKRIGEIFPRDYLDNCFYYLIEDLINENSLIDTGIDVTKEINIYQAR